MVARHGSGNLTNTSAKENAFQTKKCDKKLQENKKCLNFLRSLKINLKGETEHLEIRNSTFFLNGVNKK